jgi:hypothetical protein
MSVPLGYIALCEAYDQLFQDLHDVQALEAAFSKAGPPAEGFREGFKYSDPDAERANNDAHKDVEGRLRRALALGELDYFYLDAQTRETVRGVDRESWTKSMSPPGFGLSNGINNEIDPATCPGPPEAEGCLVFLDKKQFDLWRAKEVYASRSRPVPERALEAAYIEHVKQIGAAGHSSRQDDLEAMQRRFPKGRVTKERIAFLRNKHAPAKWRAAGKRKR